MKLVSEEFFFSLLSEAYLSCAVFVCSLEKSLVPRRPELVSSTLHCCSENAVSCVYLWIVGFFFFFISFAVLEEHRLRP